MMPRFLLIAWLAMAAFSYAQQQSLPNQQQQSEQDSRPVPDPTILTTQQSEKAVAALRELVEEKFRSVEIQFSESEKRAEQTKKDSKDAIDAALQAAKEAVEKQNSSSKEAIEKEGASITKQIDALDKLSQEMKASLNAQINGLEKRIGAIENVTLGQTSARGESRSDNSFMITVVMGIVTIASLGFAIFSRQSPPIRR